MLGECCCCVLALARLDLVRVLIAVNCVAHTHLSVCSILFSFFNRSLKTANLARNQICDEGAVALSKALKSNNTLETLELYSNKIGIAGAQSLAGMLQVNRALTSLNLYGNEIGAGGAQAIAAALPQS